jgi:hypothetical protein
MKNLFNNPQSFNLPSKVHKKRRFIGVPLGHFGLAMGDFLFQL